MDSCGTFVFVLAIWLAIHVHMRRIVKQKYYRRLTMFYISVLYKFLFK